MRGLIKMLLAGGLMTFTAYVFYVEPNASDDPAGAVSKATQRLSTICERNRAECEFLSDFGNGIGQATSIGWSLITGQGRLVYVSNDGQQFDVARPRQPGEPSGSTAGPLSSLVRSTGLFGNSDSSDRQNHYSEGNAQYRRDRQADAPTSSNSLRDLIKSTNLFGSGQTRANERDHAPGHNRGPDAYGRYRQHCN